MPSHYGCIEHSSLLASLRVTGKTCTTQNYYDFSLCAIKHSSNFFQIRLFPAKILKIFVKAVKQTRPWLHLQASGWASRRHSIVGIAIAPCVALLHFRFRSKLLKYTSACGRRSMMAVKQSIVSLSSAVSKHFEDLWYSASAQAATSRQQVLLDHCVPHFCD